MISTSKGKKNLISYTNIYGLISILNFDNEFLHLSRTCSLFLTESQIHPKSPTNHPLYVAYELLTSIRLCIWQKWRLLHKASQSLIRKICHSRSWPHLEDVYQIFLLHISITQRQQCPMFFDILSSKIYSHLSFLLTKLSFLNRAVKSFAISSTHTSLANKLTYFSSPHLLLRSFIVYK